MRGKLFVVAMLALVALAAANHNAWIKRMNSSPRTQHCITREGGNSWVRRDGFTRCGTCNARCYHAQFNTTAQTNGAPFGLCSSIGDDCKIDVYFSTAPCCACEAGTEEATVLEQDDQNTMILKSTESNCEVTRMVVLVNGYHVLPLDGDCNPADPPLFQQQWIDSENTQDGTTNSIKDCGSGTSGSRLTQAYSKPYRNGRFPDPCFTDDYLVQSVVTDNQGTLTTNFRMWRPNSNAIWFDTILSRSQAAHHVPCSQMPSDEDCALYVEPLL